MKKDVFDEMAEKWPSAIVSRQEIKTFTGGLMSAKYLANLSCEENGPPQISFGRKIGYPLNSLVVWMRERSGN